LSLKTPSARSTAAGRGTAIPQKKRLKLIKIFSY
jgi:hypothetical protein